MTMVKMIAIDGCNGHQPGDQFLATEREAKQLVDKRLAKMAGPPKNKMMPPAGNKGAVGEEPPSSASPAAPASRKTTANRSARGAAPRQPRAPRGGSSQ
ncbi:hypothetical protein [Variovorax sp.]|uniref:hypothetical protein n=1 Tax=Variovorax sp. TaxID=1871043 RepID=UPI00403809A7